MNYPLTAEDRDVLERAQTLVAELIPFEVEAEMNDGELPPDVKERHHRLARDLRLTAVVPTLQSVGDSSLLPLRAHSSGA
jgi:hypothetical protein